MKIFMLSPYGSGYLAMDWDDYIDRAMRGHEEWMYGVAAELVKMEHQVTVYMHRSMKPVVKQDGFVIRGWDKEHFEKTSDKNSLVYLHTGGLEKDTKWPSRGIISYYDWNTETDPFPIPDTWKVMAFSEWHKNYIIGNYPEAKDNVYRVYLGCDEKWRAPISETPRKMICVASASPDRSWEGLVRVWTKINKAVPRARCYITYVGNTFPEAIPDGMVILGALKQQEVHDLLAQTRLILYNMDAEHRETFCIGVYKAQACGVVPVVNRQSALPEVVKHGIVCDNDDEFVEATVSLLTDDSRWFNLHREAINDKYRTWRHVAEDMMKLWMYDGSGKLKLGSLCLN